MRLFLIIPTLLIAGCFNTFSQKGQRLDFNTLSHTERIYPTQFSYHLLEVKEGPADIQSPKYLYLYDKNYLLVDRIRLYGMVQKATDNKLEINKTMSGKTGVDKIGNLGIDYTPIEKVSKGGGIEGSFIVDSLKYNKQNFTVTIYAKKPKEQFVLHANEIDEKVSEFTIPETLTVTIMDIELKPDSKNYFSITGWDETGMYNSTRNFFTKDSAAIKNFFLSIERNGL